MKTVQLNTGIARTEAAPAERRHPPRRPTRRTQTPPAPANFRDWKHSLQKTGRPCVGLNGTVVSLPQAEQLVWVSTRSRDIPPPPAGRAARLPLQALHRFGSFLKFLSAKNCCSPAVQMNSVPQSTQLRILSWNSIGRYLVGGRSIPIRAGASSDCVSARALAWLFACRPVSDRRNAS